jgi:hypothetical protein
VQDLLFFDDSCIFNSLLDWSAKGLQIYRGSAHLLILQHHCLRLWLWRSKKLILFWKYLYRGLVGLRSSIRRLLRARDTLHEGKVIITLYFFTFKNLDTTDFAYAFWVVAIHVVWLWQLKLVLLCLFNYLDWNFLEFFLFKKRWILWPLENRKAVQIGLRLARLYLSWLSALALGLLQLIL